jgi:hypothetical protein
MLMAHQHPDFAGRTTANVLDMTQKRYTPEYVQAFLLSLPPRGTDKAGARMPNLGLAQHEVDALAAFLGR